MRYKEKSRYIDSLDAISGTLQRLDYRPTAVAVYGSVARECATLESDIDLLIIRTESVGKIARAQMIVGAKRIQIVVGSPNSFQLKMERARRERENFISHSFASSLFVDGDRSLYDRLFNLALKVEERGAPPPTNREMAGYAMRVHDTLLKLDKVAEGMDVAIAVHLSRLISFFIFRKHGRWLAPGIYGKSSLVELEPVFYSSFLFYMKSALSTGLTDVLVNHVKSFLASSGFPTWDSPFEAPF